MQDRYVGDAGDFAKYSLLKALAGHDDRLRLGINWYLFPDESHNADGRHVAYLQQPAMALRDPPVHAALSQLVGAGRRYVSEVELSSILPQDSLFYRPLVATRGPPATRAAHRLQWFRTALQRLAAADLVFFDPDNGLETPALDRNGFRAGKYAFWSEIEATWVSGQSLVVYNHLNRSASASVQTARLYREFAGRLPDTACILPLLFRRGSCRHLWVIMQPRHRVALESRVHAFLARGWAADTDAPVVTT